jgi:hypothetical protein
MVTCKIKNCKKYARKKGICGMHDMRFRRYGDYDYVTPEKVRVNRHRESFLSNKKNNAKKDTYLKYYGRHMHRVVMEKYLGRKLKKGEIVHHIDGNKHNNDIKNLELMTQSKHASLHHPEAQAKRKIKTHCPRKHPYSGDNLKIYKGRRHCKKCINIHSKKYREKNVKS